ncbi:MAG: DUF3467 domain-containing protein [Gemmataceae bacterium]
MGEETKSQETPTPTGQMTTDQPGQRAAIRDIPVDTSSLSTHYANFARVTSTPEELIIDFGLNTQMVPNPNEPVKLTHRLVMNFYTAKRLLGALHFAVQQHESQFGVLETDVNKRLMRGVGPRPSGS